MGSKNELLKKIDEGYPKFSKGQKKLADFIREDYDLSLIHIFKIHQGKIRNDIWRIGKEDPDEEGESVVKEQQHDGRKYRAVRGLPERGTF